MENQIDTRLTFPQFLAAIVLGPTRIVRWHVLAFGKALLFAWHAYRAELERTDLGLDTGIERHWSSQLDGLPIPVGWRYVDYREPLFNEYFLSPSGIGYQDGGVSFRGRQAEHIIVEKA